jgi:hypothetical protein
MRHASLCMTGICVDPIQSELARPVRALPALPLDASSARERVGCGGGQLPARDGIAASREDQNVK